MRFFTIGEIFRLKLLKNYKGEPYKDKAAVSRVVNKLQYKVKKTAWGQAKCISEEQIKIYNERLISA